MARAPVAHALPSLAGLRDRFRAASSRHGRQATLARLLRDVIQQHRGDQRQPFYSQSEVARGLGLSRGLVHLAYRKLQAEGLISCVRGSATHILGRRPQPRTTPRGVVGLPVWMAGFAWLEHWRTFFTRLESQLRRHNYVADFVFFRARDIDDPEFAERLIEHHLDHLIWLYPLARSLPLINRLGDSGLRTVAVVEPHVLPSRHLQQYHVVWDRVLSEAFTAWRQDGIRAVNVVGVTPDTTPRRDQLTALLSASLLEHEFQPLTANLDRLPGGPATGVVLPDDVVVRQLCVTAPAAMIRLLLRRRVLVRNSLPLSQLAPGATVDLVRVDWDRLAHRLAAEIATDDPRRAGTTTTVSPQWLPRVPAAQFAETF